MYFFNHRLVLCGYLVFPFISIFLTHTLLLWSHTHRLAPPFCFLWLLCCQFLISHMFNSLESWIFFTVDCVSSTTGDLHVEEVCCKYQSETMKTSVVRRRRKCLPFSLFLCRACVTRACFSFGANENKNIWVYIWNVSLNATEITKTIMCGKHWLTPLKMRKQKLKLNSHKICKLQIPVDTLDEQLSGYKTAAATAGVKCLWHCFKNLS